MKKILTAILLAGVILCPADALARKKNKKYDKHAVKIEQTDEKPSTVEDVHITDPATQLYGEWTITSIRKKTVNTQERPYVYLDFTNHQFYGNNGCNAINGRFTLSGGGVIAFKDIIATTGSCHSVTSDKTVMKTLTEVQRYHVTREYGIDYLHLTNAKGSTLMVLKRQNLDFMNGAWNVKAIDGEMVGERNFRLVIDADMLSLHGNTGCNIINGSIHIDPAKDFAIQFEDITTTGNVCDDMDAETALLVSLEQAESCKRINDNEMALLDGKGTIVVVLTRIHLR